MKTWKLIIVLALISGVVYQLHSGLERHRYTRAQQEFGYLPSTEQVRLLSLGHTETVASLMWVRGLIYFGSSLMTGSKSIWMEHLIDLITTADPKFKQAYHFTATAIQAKNLTKVGLEIQARGVREFPKDWQLALYYAMNKIDKDGDYEAASKIMEPFKGSKDVPPHITRISETFKRKALPISEALHMYLGEYLSQNDPEFRKNIKNKISYLITSSVKIKDKRIINQLFRDYEGQKLPIDTLFKKLLMVHQEFHKIQ